MTTPRKFPTLAELINLNGKKALVTGGAMGIGYAIADRLSEAGAAVALLDFNEEKGRKSRLTLEGMGRRVYFVHCDLSREEEISRAFSNAVSQMAGLDILVNNAGIFPFTPLDQVSAEQIDRVLAVNVKAMILLSREFSRLAAEKQRGGLIVNIASVDALHPSHKGLSIYDASKGAVLSLTKSLAKELAPRGVRVNAIAPGGILTEGALAQRGPENARADLKEFMARIPLGRMGVADDIARVALFLASDLSAYMTGELIVADGGYLLS
jgi:2-dehydro-3-deoxy-D-gluconate 5-dehydrogenase